MQTLLNAIGDSTASSIRNTPNGQGVVDYFEQNMNTKFDVYGVWFYDLNVHKVTRSIGDDFEKPIKNPPDILMKIVELPFWVFDRTTRKIVQKTTDKENIHPYIWLKNWETNEYMMLEFSRDGVEISPLKYRGYPNYKQNHSPLIPVLSGAHIIPFVEHWKDQQYKLIDNDCQCFVNDFKYRYQISRM